MTHADPGPGAAPLDMRSLAHGAVLLGWTAEDGTAARNCQVLFEGAAARPPMAHTAVPLGSGRARNMIAVRLADPARRAAAVEVRNAGGRVIAASDGSAASRFGDLDSVGLLSGLDAAGRVRVARFFIEVCANLLQLGDDAEFIANCLQIVGEINRKPGALAPRCAVLDRYVLCETTLRAGLGSRLSAVVIGPGVLRRVPFAPAPVHDGPQTARMPVALLLDRAAADPGMIVAIFGENGMACRRMAAAPPESSSAIEWTLAARDKAATRRYLLDCLARIGAEHPQAAALLRELQVLGPRRGQVVTHGRCPVAAGVDLMVGTESGLLVAGWIKDPQRLAQAIEIERAERRQALPLDAVARFPHRAGEAKPGEPAGFAGIAASQGGVAPEAPCRVRLRLRSGEGLELAEGPSILTASEARDAVLAAIPPDQVGDAALASCLEPALAALHARIAANRAAPELIAIGAEIAAPSASLVVPVGHDAEIVRCRLGMIATDPGLSEVELIHVLDRPRDRDAAERLLRALYDVFGVGSRLAVMPDRTDTAAALNAGAALARGSLLLFLGAGVVPEHAGWLARMQAFMTAHPRVGIVAPRLVFEDHSIAAAGLEFGPDRHGAWDLRPAYRGFPRDFAAAAADGPVAAAAGCLALRRSLFELVGGFAEDALMSAHRDADLCLRARAQAFETWRLAEPALVQLGPDEDAKAVPGGLRALLAGRLLERRWRTSIESGAADPPALTAAVDRARARAPARGRAA